MNDREVTRAREVRAEHPDLDRPLGELARHNRRARGDFDARDNRKAPRRDSVDRGAAHWRDRSRSRGREPMSDRRDRSDRRNVVRRDDDRWEDRKRGENSGARERNDADNKDMPDSGRDGERLVRRDLRDSIQGRGYRDRERERGDRYHERREENSPGRREQSSQHNRENRRPSQQRSYSEKKRLSEVQPRDLPADQKLRKLDDDPRVRNGEKAPVGNRQGKGRNTESFDPESTLVRPDLRVVVGPNRQKYNRPLKHDDVIVVPEFFCAEDNWDIYYKLVEEMRALQADGERQSEWIPWHEGCHLVTKAPEKSPTFQNIMKRVTEYFNLRPESQGYRFNWYRDSSDWKPFHHDSAAFNPQRARTQNITVGVSFGATRELAFLHAEHGARAYFPQSNGMMFSFGRDTNIKWKHGVNALPLEEQHGKGRISIVVWGLAQDCVEEDDSPKLVVNSRPGHPGHHHHHSYRHHEGTGRQYR